MNNTTVANLATIGGITVATIIAGFSFPVSLSIIGATTLGCAYLTYKEGK